LRSSSKRDAPFALFVYWHERHVDRARLERVGSEARVRKQHVFDRKIELVCERRRDVCGHALRPPIVIFDDEEDRLLGREHEGDAQLARRRQPSHRVIVRGSTLAKQHGYSHSS